MGNRTMAVRYAKALAGALPRDGDFDRIEVDLRETRALLKEHGELRKALVSAGIPTSRRKRVAEKIFAAIDLHPASRRLLVLLVESGAFGLLEEIHEAFGAECDERRRIVAAEVTTAVEVAPERTSEYRRSLERLTGKAVRVKTHVDPSILGGVVTRIGSQVYDGSLRGRLERLQQRLKGE
jgi:F-type H+-transporting ATPase subunit delta